MNKIAKYLIVGFAGYTIGKLEVKYKLIKWALDTVMENKKENKEDEAQ